MRCNLLDLENNTSTGNPHEKMRCNLSDLENNTSTGNPREKIPN